MSADKRLRTQPIQFTKAELRVIEAGAKMMTSEWYNGYRSQTRVLAAASVISKVTAVLYPRPASGSPPEGKP